MTAPVQYIMHGQMPSAPYQDVTWVSWNEPDPTGAQSGYGANFLINIYVDYTITDNIVAGGNQQAAQIPPPPPSEEIIPVVTYVMKALCSLTQPVNQMVTWRSTGTADFAGLLSGFPPSSLSDIVVDYTINDSVTAGPQANQVINILVGPAFGDLSGSYPSPIVIGIDGKPIDFTGLQAGDIIAYTGTQWAVQPAGSGTFAAGGDLTGSDINQTVIGLRTKPLSSSLSSIGINEDGYTLIWDNTDGYWTASPLFGDVIGSIGNNILDKLKTKLLDPTLSTIGSLQDGYVLTWNNTASEWKALPASGGTLNGDVTGPAESNIITTLKGKLLDPNLNDLGPGTNGYVLTWVNADQQWEAIAPSGGTLNGDVTGAANSNTVIKLQHIPIASGTPNDGYVLTYNSSGNEWVGASAPPPTGVIGGDLYGSLPNPLLYKISGGNGHNFVNIKSVTDGVGGTYGFQWVFNSGVDTTPLNNTFHFVQQDFTLSTNPTDVRDGYHTIIKSGNGQSLTALTGSGGTGGTLYLQSGTRGVGTDGAFDGPEGDVSISCGDSGSSITLDGGDGNISINSLNEIDIIANAAVNITSTSNNTLTIPTTATQLDWSHDILNLNLGGFPSLSIDSSTSPNHTKLYPQSTSGSAFIIHGRDGGVDGGNVYIEGGSGSGLDGYIYIGGGVNDTSTQVELRSVGNIYLRVSAAGITLPQLAGSGSGFATISNTGIVGFSSGITPTGSAGGDLSGTYPNPSVVKIQGKTLASSLASIGSAQDGYVLTWVNGSSDWEAKPNAAITTIGIINTSPNSNGLFISGNTISTQTASATEPGMVSIGTQTLAGDKTLSGSTTLSALSTGIIHSGSGGALTSSLIVNADISTSANIAVSKLAAGTSAQILLNNATPTPTWTSISGDIAITSSGATTVEAIWNRAIHDSTPNPGDVIAWDGSNSWWHYATNSAVVTWADDLAGSSNSGQFIAAISGNGGGGTVNLGSNGNTGLSLQGLQSSTPVNAGSITIIGMQAYSNTNSDGYNSGNLFLRSIFGGDGNGTNKVGGNSGTINLITGSGGAATGISNNSNSGNINITTGVAGTGGSGTTGTVGSILLNPGTSNMMTVSTVGVNIANLAGFGTGVVSVDNSGNLGFTSSGGGTLAGDVTGAIGSNTVVKIQGKTLSSSLSTIGATQDGYVLTWVNASSDWEAKPGTGGGGGVTTVGTIDTNANSNGLFISGSTISTQSASATNPGMMNTTTQTIAGAKTFTGAFTAGSSTTKNSLVGGLSVSTFTCSSSLTLADGYYQVFVNTSSARSITLPAPSNGREFWFTDITGSAETNNITIVRNGTEQINGIAASKILQTNWGSWRCVSDGTNWWING